MSSWSISPLRYPGGKGAIAPFLGRLLLEQSPRCETYVEPFAGGAGAALRLLYDEYVRTIVLNDIDPGIAALWRAVFYQTDALVARILAAELTTDVWREQQHIYRNPSGKSDVSLGFATLYLNRTNRSGILNAWPIGGIAQTGPWKMDARFNHNRLAWRVRELGRYRNRVTILEEDGIALVERYMDDRYFIYADPPYLQKGGDLYTDRVTWDGHQRLATALRRGDGRWMVSYDQDERVAKLYPTSPIASFRIGHTARTHRQGHELAVFGNRVEVNDLSGLGTDGQFMDGHQSVGGRPHSVETSRVPAGDRHAATPTV